MKREIPKELEAKLKKNMTRLVYVVIAIVLLISIDILLVAKLNVGPFLAIRTKVYKDGGTKEYYGLGYKVIKYHQTIGRRDTQIGFWNMSYSDKATEISMLDLALELRNYPTKNYKKFYNQFLQIEGTISKIDKKKKQITLHYSDDDGAYALNVVCTLVDEKLDMDDFQKDEYVTVVGTFKEFNNKEKTMKVGLSNSFVVEA